MTASTVSRRGERFDRAQIVVDLEHREVVEHLLGDSGSAGGTGTGESLDAFCLEDREEGGTAREALSRITSPRHGDGHDLHPHRR